MSAPAPLRYREHPPPAALAPLVECFWTIQGVAPPGRPPDRVLPDGCSDVLFDLGDGTRVGSDPRPRRYAVGTMTRAIRVAHRGTVDLVAVRFRPGGARAFVDVPAGELVDDWVDADELWGAFAAELWERMANTGSTGGRVRLLEGALAARAETLRDSVDPLVLRAAALLAGDGDGRRWAEAPGRAPAVARVADRLGVSRRHLERRFRGDVGLTPAQLRRVGRLRRAVGLMAGSEDPLGQVAVRAGYHDQAHMGRDFRELAGVTPGGYRRELGRP